jgi:hypothetical protein
MTGRVRGHRRPGPGEGWVALTVFFLGAVVLCGGATAVWGWIVTSTAGRVTAAVAAGLLAAGYAGRSGLRAWHRRQAQAALAAWPAAAGWEPVVVGGPWPWTHLQRTPGVAVVRWAYTRFVDGFDVTAGEIDWHDDGLGRAVRRPEGSGVFVWVRLPAPVAGMSVRVQREQFRRRRGEDEFRRRFETIGFDSFRLDDPAFRAAHVSGDVPPWTAIDSDLFAFVPVRRPVTPDAVEDAVRRTLRVVTLLDLGPDRASE